MSAERRPARLSTVEEFHHAIVRASESQRLEAVHRQVGAELRLFVLQLPPAGTFERIASDHLELVRLLESEGPEALRAHIAEATDALPAVSGR